MKRIRLVLSFVMMLAVVILCRLPVSASDTVCISEIHIEKGKNAISTLEEAGYTAVFRNLNPSGKGERIHLGYKCGGEAITGLVVSSEKKDQLTFEGAVYKPVSSLSLNQGNGGKALYLYYTRDKAAGSGIVSLNMVLRDEKNDVDPLDYLNDGSSAVRTVEGNAADLEAGVKGSSLYLFTVPRELCLPYISALRTVAVKNGESLFDTLVASGCDYYVAEPISENAEGKIYLAYDRTSDVTEAITYAAVSDADVIGGVPFARAGELSEGDKALGLYYTRSLSVGAPVTEITKGIRMGESFALGDWAAAYFGGEITSARANLFSSEEYALLSASEEAYTQLAIHTYEEGRETGETGLYLVLAADASPLVIPEETETEPEEETTETDMETEIEPEAEGVIDDAPPLPEEENEGLAEEELLTDGSLHDTEEEDFSREEETSEDTSTEEGDEGLGSVIGSGSLIATAVLLIMAVIVVFIVVMIRGRKFRKEE